MGIIVQNYRTPEGFLVPELYIELNFIRLLRSPTGTSYGCVYSCLAFKSLEDRQLGVNPLPLPNSLSTGEEYLPSSRFYEQTIFGFAYDSLKSLWQGAGYTVRDSFSQPPTPKTFTYDCSGYTFLGFNSKGWDREGYDTTGFNAEGWDRQGYGRDGYTAEGYDRQGYDRTGYNEQGYDRLGFNHSGYDAAGYDKTGFNAEGYSRSGYDRAGYDKDGYDRNGYDTNGLDKNGSSRPIPILPTSTLQISTISVSIGNQISTMIGVSTMFGVSTATILQG